ncbi:MAG: DEAD/DEAH box helicase, partial [Myxococcota bacterium]
MARRENTLIAAPTGSGKTLAAFFVAIDDFYQRARPRASFGCDVTEPFRLEADPASDAATSAPSQSSPERPDQPKGVEVLYISPLKALAADIQENLSLPLTEIEALARSMGFPVPEIRVAMRTGDTSASARAAMLKKPPQILVTTPESLYLLLTSARGREMLRPVRSVIVDEIHTMARDKRGSHLTLSLERLEALCDEVPIRIGLSATQRPIELVAKLLVGVGPERVTQDGRPRCTIVDEGHRRTLDLETVLPETELEAVASAEQMDEILDRIAEQVQLHQTTLVFVNTRRMAERLAHQLAGKLGEEEVAAHHGSLSQSRRFRVEEALRAGRLRALVATASLELGIDVGPVGLVCQIGSPRSIATFLQRVGRSGHFRGGIPKGRLYPLTRDELVESAGLLRAVRHGRLDRLLPPTAPLDILAQQIVAACAAEPWKEEELYQLVRRAAPFEGLTRTVFDEVVQLVSEGIVTGRGRRAAYLHRDQIGGMLRARRGARLAALTSGGAIPDVADYRVIAEPDETFIGSVSEDFAIDSLPGDVFLLGSATWRIRRVEAGKLLVVDAGGANPSIPFWVGEAPARSEELSDEVSFLRQEIETILLGEGEAAAARWLEEETGVGSDAAIQIARYLAVARSALGGLPTRNRLVLERFFDDSGGMQLVIHSPRGARLNRALCLGLRKKFCKNFNFELQAAANDDAMVLSLGPHHSFPLSDVPRFLRREGLRDTLIQAVLPTPLFAARWRWNLNRSLAILRFRGGKKNPPVIQRMEADDLMAAIFPQAAACQENIAGPIEIPNHPLVRQTMDDCLTDAMDIEGLQTLIERIETNQIEILCVDTTEPSPLAHEILNGRPYTFLDDAPLEERRTRAVRMRRGLPVEERDLSRLDPGAIGKIREQAAPAPRDAEELHDLLLGVGVWRAETRWQKFFRELESAGRALALGAGKDLFWIAKERLAWLVAIHPEWRDACAAEFDGEDEVEETEAITHVLRGHLETTGPITARRLAERIAIRPGLVEIGLAQLESEGFVLRGCFEESSLPLSSGENREPSAKRMTLLADSEPEEQFCARRLLARIHHDSQSRLRASVAPVTPQELMRFLLAWQHVAPGTQYSGAPGVAQVVEQLQGFDLAAGAWESEILAARVKDYRPEWLDPLCFSGAVSWLRLAPPVLSAWKAPRAGRLNALSRVTPLSLVLREDLPWLLQAHRRESAGASAVAQTLDGVPIDESARQGTLADQILILLNSRGALFYSQLVETLSALPVEIEMALWTLVASGQVGADGFQALRSLLGSRTAAGRARAARRGRRGLRRGLATGPAASAEGRWFLVPPREAIEDLDRVAEAIAEQLLLRWGIVFRDLVVRENLALPWREIVWAFRRLEARGSIRGGRFVSSFTGEQYALPEALET